MNADRIQFWGAAVTTACAALLVGLAGWALVAVDPTGLGRAAYVGLGATNAVAVAASGLVVRQRLTGRGDVDEAIARTGCIACLVSGTFLPTAAAVDEPDWRLLFLGLGLVLALVGVAIAAVAPRAVRARLGLDAGWPN
ncbi:hypothetical protein C475_07861 [Halosimplex carlsbadense 2-9-1]|uniref:Uncharacterized protein n=1 Tax=Halosimplex carlsbadense 2-9-1 TaxID=797114 RepID=M0CW04_9EURY|nr:hypothetical protein [Halosimplex carlsbadense]ELZ26833.1 hypothetical protein C475_07861 [Halosimplex carlsbadense 2-9-1]